MCLYRALINMLPSGLDCTCVQTMSVLHPFSATEQSIMQEADLAGPLVFCLMFGATLLATGRVQFGYIYGVAMLGCVGLYTVLNFMSLEEMTLGLTASVLGYCLLPMVALSAIGIVLSLKSVVFC
jgi:protein YIPF5/7